MQKSKKNYLLIGLIIVLLAIAVGYANVSQRLQITGTATAKGDWDIHFANASITNPDENNTATISNNDHTLTVNVALTQPGDSQTVTVDVVNEGTVDATLTGFEIVAADGESATLTGTDGVYTTGAIKMTLQQLSTGTDLSAKTGKTTYTMNFEWPADYIDETVNDKATFTITFNYSQKV